MKKRTQEVTSTQDQYFVAYETDDKVYIINDDLAFEIEKNSKDSEVQERKIILAADIVIDKQTKTVIKSRWF